MPARNRADKIRTTKSGGTMSDQPLTWRRIAVGGGTGDIGIEIVRALLLAGADVVVPARDPRKAETLRSFVSHSARLTILDGFPVDDTSAERIGKAIGEIHGAVASLGGWHQGGPLARLPLADWNATATGNLASHFLFAKAVIPRIPPGGQYVMLNGAAALSPVPGAGHVSVMAAAQLMLGAALRQENQRLLFHTLMLNSLIATRARPNPDPSWVTAEDIGGLIVWLFGDQGSQTAGSTITVSARQDMAGTLRSRLTTATANAT